MYRIIVSLLFVFGLYGGVSAQSLASFKERLSQPAGSAAVTVVEHGDAAGVVSRESQSNDRIRFKGYRIGIFFDNGAEARGLRSVMENILMPVMYNVPTDPTIIRVTIDEDTVEGGEAHMEYGAVRKRYKNQPSLS